MILLLAQAVPTDLGPYGVLVGLFVMAATGFSIAVRWLDARDKARAVAFEVRIKSLEDDMAGIKGASKAARVLIVEAVSLLPVTEKEVAAKLIEAMRALE